MAQPSKPEPTRSSAQTPSESTSKSGYKVFVDDNFHHMDPTERYELGAFPTLEEAIAACKRIVDECLQQWAERDITAKELYELYVMFGEDPFIVPGNGGFSAWDYARERSQALAKRKAGSENRPSKGSQGAGSSKERADPEEPARSSEPQGDTKPRSSGKLRIADHWIDRTRQEAGKTLTIIGGVAPLQPKQEQLEAKAPDFKPGIYAQGRIAATAVVQQWAGVSPFRGDKVEAAMDASQVAQAELAKAGQQIVAELGEFDVKFINPGVRTNRERIMERFEERDRNAALLTDLAHATFLVQEPQHAGPVIERLAKRFGLVDTGWLQTPVGYGDKTLNLQFANGLIGEVLIMPPEMYKASRGEGRRLYEEMRALGVIEEQKPGKPTALKYATFELHPCVYDDEQLRGWVKFGQEWREIDYADICLKGKVASRAEFDQIFAQLSMPNTTSHGRA